ncbi:Cytochrome b-c1 complex subunit 6 protein [Dioscorea alata]|uniref:Cytochrome b-c1 complex subunit 6 protein n=1 Tax=Dioscorea alata TaxID=55571 RepID=A0ACB7WCJ0_DIOAL|nr:Cytochrome b-c1 complex subunit 6 protein [Dioscorea alata]
MTFCLNRSGGSTKVKFPVSSTHISFCRFLSLSSFLKEKVLSLTSLRAPFLIQGVEWISASESMEDDEPVDPKKYLEEQCKPKCVRPLFQYQECSKRIRDDKTGHKHCTGQYFDYWACIDKCVAAKLFDMLK